MGTWGPANFADDVALDWLGELVGEVADEIDRGIRTGDPADFCGHSLVGQVEVLAVLCEQFPTSPPDPETVAGWREMYLEAWDAEIDGWDPEPQYKADRRRVIEATFARLEAVAKRWQKESS